MSRGFHKRYILGAILILTFATIYMRMRSLIVQAAQDSTDSYEKSVAHRKETDEHGNGDYGDEHSEGAIELDREAREMIRLKTDKVAVRALKGRLKVYGKVARDAENISYITYDGEGVVDNIEVSLGEIVDKGTPLLSIRKNDGSTEQIVSDKHATVFSIFVKPYERIDHMTSLLSLVNLDILRSTIDVYEKDLRLVKVGQKVVLTTAAFPEKEFYGKVVYISPQIDEHTQAIQVRVDVDNREHLLRLGMFISGDLIYASDDKALTVPVSAIQQLGGEEVVFVQEEPGHYERRDVILGRGAEGYTEVKKGLRDGDIVVTQGSFYLKSEIEKGSFGGGHNH